MLNIKKAINVSEIWIHNLIPLSLILFLFCWLGNAFAQMPPALDFPPERDFDPRHPRDIPRIGTLRAISENVELVGATGGNVYNVFVQDNYT